MTMSGWKPTIRLIHPSIHPIGTNQCLPCLPRTKPKAYLTQAPDTKLFWTLLCAFCTIQGQCYVQAIWKGVIVEALLDQETEYSGTCLKKTAPLAIKIWSLKTGSLCLLYQYRFIYIEMDFLPKTSGTSRQVLSHGSGPSRQVLIVCVLHVLLVVYCI